MEALKATVTPERRKLLLKLISLGAGVFLVVAGILGSTAPILGGGLVYFIGALYAIIFGLIVLVVEMKDKAPIISVAYGLLDKYLKFLTLQVRSEGASSTFTVVLLRVLTSTQTRAHSHRERGGGVATPSFRTGGVDVNRR